MRNRRVDAQITVITALAASNGWRLDANETAVFARQLEDIDAQLYRVVYPQLKGTALVPVKTDIDPGAEEYTYRVMDYAGQSKPIANYADDLPRVDVQGKEVTTKLFSHGAAYGYSLQDLRRSRMTGLGLDSERAMACREVIARKNDTIIATGDSTVGLTGFLNNANVSLVSPATGTWSSATAEQIADDLFKIERAIIADSKGVEMPDTVVLPPSLFALASTKRLSNTTTTAMEFFLAKALGVRNVEHWYPLETAGSGGVARIVMYTRDPSKLSALLPLEFNQLPPEARNLAFVINCDSRAGGVAVRYPGSMRYMDGC